MGEFFSDLKGALGRRMLWEVVLGVRRNDLLGLAGQLAYFFLLFFPFLIFLVSLTGLVVTNPRSSQNTRATVPSSANRGRYLAGGSGQSSKIAFGAFGRSRSAT